MKKHTYSSFLNIAAIASFFILSSCGGGNTDTVELPFKKGDITFDSEINKVTASKGESLFQAKCSSCHNFDADLIGPSLAGVTSRREPHWIMNMMLKPEIMIKQDPDAVKLFKKYNKVPMVINGGNPTKEEALTILEYLRDK